MQGVEQSAGLQMPMLSEYDPDVADIIRREVDRQREGLELIASENFVSEAVLEAMGTPLTNKYAEGLPGKRYYGGCEFVDQVEQLAIDRAKQLFNAEHANVQAHSGAQANAAVYLAFLKPGDTVLGLDLSQGGHLTHGSPVNFSGLLYHAIHYGVGDDGRIDYDQMREIARRERPKMIIAGASAYARIIEFEPFAEVAREIGAKFIVDMAHIAGLVATGFHPSPIPHADAVTTTTHKTLRGPRGGLILCKAEHAKVVDKAMFPGTQGGPLEHVIAAKAVCLKEAMDPSFAEYAARVVRTSRALAQGLADEGVRIVSGGTDSHLALCDLRPLGIGGKQAEAVYDEIGIAINKNGIPFDPQPPLDPSGIRVGTPGPATLGMDEPEMKEVSSIIGEALRNPGDERVAVASRARVAELVARFPAYPR